jgi:hypothetical protein
MNNFAMNRRKARVTLHSNSSTVTLGAAFIVISQVLMGIIDLGGDDNNFTSPELLAGLLPEFDILNRNEPNSPGYNSELYAAAHLLDILTTIMDGLNYLMLSGLYQIPGSDLVSLLNLLNRMMTYIDQINEGMIA